MEFREIVSRWDNESIHVTLPDGRHGRIDRTETFGLDPGMCKRYDVFVVPCGGTWRNGVVLSAELLVENKLSSPL